MKSYLLFRILIVSLCLAQAEILTSEVDEIRDKLSSNTTQSSNGGNRFYVTFPVNDRLEGVSQVNEIYVSSKSNTRVCLRDFNSNILACKDVNVGEVTVFSSVELPFLNNFINDSYQIINSKSIEVIADDDIVVYVLISKLLSSDGYFAIPVNKLGSKYVHCSSYDVSVLNSWGGGFIVTATEDNTRVTCRLRGEGGNASTTTEGTRLGQTLTVTLNKGHSYNVKGIANTSGYWDISGTEITSTKPVSIVSYHQRAIMPPALSSNPNATGRSFLIVQQVPCQSWGRQYLSVEFDGRNNKGDFFRVLASENNTKGRIRWYDISTNKIIGDRNIELNSGEFFEYLNIEPGITSESIRGLVHFTADKPIFVMQYEYSSDWDDSQTAKSSSMLPVIATVQYVKESIFIAPTTMSDGKFSQNTLTLMIKGIPQDNSNNLQLMNSIELDGQKFVDMYPEIITNQIPGTDYFWARVKVGEGYHHLKADSVFGAYLNGRADDGTGKSYSWVAASDYMELNYSEEIKDELDNPIIKVNNINLGQMPNDLKFCVENYLGKNNGLQISNIGKLDLQVNGISQVKVNDVVEFTGLAGSFQQINSYINPFEFSNPVLNQNNEVVEFPIFLPANQSIIINDLCYQYDKSISSDVEIYFSSNSAAIQNVSKNFANLKAEVVLVSVQSKEFNEILINQLKDGLKIENPLGLFLNLELYDMSSTLIHNESINASTTIPIDGLRTGTYFVKITNGLNVEIHKITIIN